MAVSFRGEDEPEERQPIEKDAFSMKAFDATVAELMDNIDDLKNQIPENNNSTDLEFVDKSFFKRVMKDITGIKLDGATLKVFFERGVTMKIESSSPHEATYNSHIREDYYRVCKIVGELVNLKQLELRTSPFVIRLSKEELKAEYKKSLDEQFHELIRSMNSHDAGINCWGGWGGHVRSSYDELKLEESLMVMIQRMQQLNIDDYAGNISRMSTLVRNVYKGLPVSINPLILGKLIIEYDLQNDIMANESSYFKENPNTHKLVIIRDVETDIDYKIFRMLILKLNAEYNEVKTKIQPRSDE